MCTVTLVAMGNNTAGGGVRMLCSRDESRSRPPALPPVEKAFGDRLALMPIDPASGGTWVAVNDAGLMMTLLNRNPGDMRGVTFPGKASRGGIIPRLLHTSTLSEVLDTLKKLDVSGYAPFRLLLAHDKQLAVVIGGDAAIRIERQTIGRPLMLTSSGLGDALVEGPRRELFDGWFGDDPSGWQARQDAFHRHRWADRPELSVNMSREDALTVSLTEVRVGRDDARLTYHPGAPDQPGRPVTLRLNLHSRVVRS